VSEVIKWIIFSLLIVLILIFLYLRNGKLQKDFFLLVFLFQFSIYVFVAPNFYSMNLEVERVNVYSTIQFLCLLFYLVPFLFTYFYLTINKERNFKCEKNESSLSKIIITSKCGVIFLFLFILLILSFIFIYVAINFNLIFKRIGHEALYKLTNDVPKFLYYPYKIFTELSLFLIVLIYLIKRKTRQKSVYFFSSICLGIYLISYGGYVIINNRLQTLILIFTLLGFNLILINKAKLFTRSSLLIILISVYSLKVVTNIRNNFFDNAGNIQVTEVFNPFYQTEYDSNDPLSNRLNGIDLISLYYPKMYDKGFAYFDPWIHGIKIYFGSFLNTDYYKNSKENLSTNSRSIIIKKYLNMDIVDYNQCQLTDIFAVLGPFSLIFASVFTAYLFFKMINSFYYEKNIFIILVSIMIIPFALEFEKDFMNLAISWLKYIPIIFMIYKLNIFKIV